MGHRGIVPDANGPAEEQPLRIGKVAFEQIATGVLRQVGRRELDVEANLGAGFDDQRRGRVPARITISKGKDHAGGFGFGRTETNDWIIGVWGTELARLAFTGART